MNKASYEVLKKAIPALEKKRERLDWVVNHDHWEDHKEHSINAFKCLKQKNIEQATRHKQAAEKALRYARDKKSFEKLLTLKLQISEIEADITAYEYSEKLLQKYCV